MGNYFMSGCLLHEWVCNHMCGYVLNVLCTHLKTRTPRVGMCACTYMCGYVLYVCMYLHVRLSNPQEISVRLKK